MNTTDFFQQLDTRISKYDLLCHPFYKAWSEGKLTREDLREYAQDYYHHVEAFPSLHGVFVLRLHVTVADLNGVELIGANAAVEELLKASFAVKEPLVSPLDDRHRKWPILVAYQQKCAVRTLRIDGDALLLAGLCCKIGSMLPVLSVLATEDDAFTAGTKHVA